MSWDVFVQQLPEGVRHVADIPDDFVPGALGTRREIVAGIRDVFPKVDFSDPEWDRVERRGFSIEVNMGADDPVMSFALHIRGDRSAAVRPSLTGSGFLRSIHSLLQGSSTPIRPLKASRYGAGIETRLLRVGTEDPPPSSSVLQIRVGAYALLSDSRAGKGAPMFCHREAPRSLGRRTI